METIPAPEEQPDPPADGPSDGDEYTPDKFEAFSLVRMPSGKYRVVRVHAEISGNLLLTGYTYLTPERSLVGAHQELDSAVAEYVIGLSRGKR